MILEREMKVLMTGGGTAGHVNPAIAIAKTIKRHHPDATIEFVSSNLPNDKAVDLVSRAGYKLHRVDICGSFAIYDPRNLKTLYYMIKSKGQAKRIVADFKPDIIIGTGGFACYPVLNAGAEMGIPTLVHESNAIAGKAVKKLAGKVDSVITNFESTTEQLKGAKRITRVGNPSIFDGSKTAKGDNSAKNTTRGKNVLIFGGSGGSETMNDGVVGALTHLAEKFPDVEFYHASGKRDYERMKSEYARTGLDKRENVVLTDYIYDMDERMARCDLLVCRAGAMTVSEAALLGKTVVFVPSPYVVANHQYKNAKAIYDKGACELCEEREFPEGKLEHTIEELLQDEAKCRTLGEKMRAFAAPDANERIYAEIKRLIEK